MYVPMAAQSSRHSLCAFLILTHTVRTYPANSSAAGHIACDSLSKSEIVVPIVVPRTRLSMTHQAAMRGEGSEHLTRAWSGRGESDDVILGVLDIDCETPNAFDEEDVQALQQLLARVSRACDWCIE